MGLDAEDVTMKSKTTEPSCKASRWSQDWALFSYGIIFILLLVGAIFGLGWYRGWNAPSGYTHNITITSQKRFLPEPYSDEVDLYSYIPGRNSSDSTGTWYYWKNKPSEVTQWTRLFVWLSYAGHQITAWAVLYLAQLKRIENQETKYTSDTTKYNWMFFALNVLFHILHLLQSHLTYDALAQDVTIVSSQCSVIMILVLVLLMEYTERGIFFGWPMLKHTDKVSTKLRLNYKPIHLVRKYHGYAFAWGAIYTFWYHPMENTYGHALGFIYTWLILLQGSLLHTNLHMNRWWRLLQESWLIVHGGLVAVQTGGPSLNGTSLWPMFTFGFLLMFAFSWIYILDFWSRIPGWVKAVPLLIYLAVTVASYSVISDKDGRNWVRMQEVIRIPSVFYLGFIFAWAVLYFFLWIERKVVKEQIDPSPFKQIVCLSVFMAIYSVFIGLSAAIQLNSIPLNMFIGMISFCFIFVFGAVLGCMMIKLSLPVKKVGNQKIAPMQGNTVSTHF
jgi:hypothetical protein